MTDEPCSLFALPPGEVFILAPEPPDVLLQLAALGVVPHLHDAAVRAVEVGVAAVGHRPVEETVHGADVLVDTKVHEVFTITEKDPLRAVLVSMDRVLKPPCDLYVGYPISCLLLSWNNI